MWQLIAPAILSGLLLWAAFFPLDYGFLGWVALVPWLLLVRAEVPRWRRYLAAYLGGMVFSALATQWLRVAHPMMYLSWAAFTLVLPVFWVIALAGIRALDRRGVPWALAVPSVWLTLEYVRMHFPTGFPFLKPLGLYQMIGFGWYFLGYTQHDALTMIQVADVGGIYAVSAMVATVNGLCAEWLWHWLSRRRETLPGHNEYAGRQRSRPLFGCSVAGVDGRSPLLLKWSTAAVAVVLGAAAAYGWWQLHHEPFEPGPRVAALQGVIPQFQKNERGESLIRAYIALHREAVPQQPDLIVWPETCFPVDYCEVRTTEDVREEFAEYARRSRELLQRFDPRVPTLLGLNALVWQDGREHKYNSALLVLPGPQRFGGRYDKMHLVPFGEYVPLGDVVPFLHRLTPYEREYACQPGEDWTRFRFRAADGRKWSFACLICYEDTDPYLARQYVAGPATAAAAAAAHAAEGSVDFFVNISNDGWFDGTEEHEQHLAICRFRAVETRRSFVRAVNMGISGVIDPDGRVIALPEPADSPRDWVKSKKVEAIVTAVVPIDRRRSIYAELGDWVPATCFSLWLGLILFIRPWPSRPKVPQLPSS